MQVDNDNTKFTPEVEKVLDGHTSGITDPEAQALSVDLATLINLLEQDPRHQTLIGLDENDWDAWEKTLDARLNGETDKVVPLRPRSSGKGIWMTITGLAAAASLAFWVQTHGPKTSQGDGNQTANLKSAPPATLISQNETWVDDEEAMLFAEVLSEEPNAPKGQRG